MAKAKKRLPHIICCIPLSWEYIPRLFFLSWYNMQTYATGRYQFSIHTNTMCYSDTARDILAKEAIKHNPDYLLWIDADQIYPANTPEILMNHIDSGKLIVGGLTPHGVSGQPLAYDMIDTAGLCRARALPLQQGVVKVGALGLGGIMMSPEVFKILEYPWFRMKWSKRAGFRPGMDFQFFGHCKKAGIDVWADTDLIFGHVVVGLREMKEPKANIDGISREGRELIKDDK